MLISISHLIAQGSPAILPAGPVRSGSVRCLKCTNGKFSLANPGREVIIIPAKTHSCCAARAASQSRIGEW